MPTLADTRLAELMCTRLCHDITGPVGAIANGAEFLAEEDSGMQDQAIELITQSASEAVNRVQFYRMAYGRVNHRGEASLMECKTLIQNYLSSGRVTLDWPEQHMEAAGIPLNRNVARLLYNMLILAVGTLIRGGVIAIRLQKKEGQSCLVISASGLTIKWDEKIQRALSQNINIEELDPSTVQAYFTQKLAKEAEVTLQTNPGSEAFEITALLHG